MTYVGLPLVLANLFGIQAGIIYAVDPPQVTEQVTVTDSVTVNVTGDAYAPPPTPVSISVSEQVGVSDSVSPPNVTGAGASAEPDETIEPNFIGEVTKVEDDTGPADSSRVTAHGNYATLVSYSAGISDPKIVTVLTSTQKVVKVVVDQSTVLSNPYTPDGVDAIETGWKIMVSADKPVVVGADAPRESLANAKQLTVVPDKPLGSHKRCTVVEQTSAGTSLACDDGVQITVSQTGLAAGSNAVILVHPEQPSKVISTAQSLMNRMSRFQSQMAGGSDITVFTELNKKVGEGFWAAQEQATSKAPPGVQAMMQKLSSISQRITSLAARFTSSGANVIAASGEVAQLAGWLREVAGSPSMILDVMIDGYESNESQESKNELKALIKAQSGAHFAQLSSALNQAASQLDSGDLEDAIYTLEQATSMDESWEQSTVMPIMEQHYKAQEQEFLAEYEKDAEQLKQDVIEEIKMVEELLAQDTSWMESGVKSDLESKLAELKTASESNDAEKMFAALTEMVELMQSLPAEGEGGSGEGTGASLSEMVGFANDEITTAESILEGYGEGLSQADSEKIQTLINGLKGVLNQEEQDKDEIYTALMSLADALKAFEKSGEGSSEGSASAAPTGVVIQCPPMQVIGHEVKCSFSYEAGVQTAEWTAVFSADGSQQTQGDSLFTGSYGEVGTVSLSLKACGGSSCVDVSHTIEIVEPPKNGGSTEQEDHQEGEGSSSSGDHDSSSSEQSTSSSGGEGSSGHAGESSESQTVFSIQLQCYHEIEVGRPIGCSFQYNRSPDKITWTAAGGEPSTGSGNAFETTFGAVGQYSISLEACVASNCVSGSQAINVYASEKSSEGTEGEPKNVGSDDDAGEGTEGQPKNVGSDDDAGEGTPSSGGQGTSGSSSSN